MENAPYTNVHQKIDFYINFKSTGVYKEVLIFFFSFAGSEGFFILFKIFFKYTIKKKKQKVCFERKRKKNFKLKWKSVHISS